MRITVMPLEQLIWQNLNPNEDLAYGLLPCHTCTLQN